MSQPSYTPPPPQPAPPPAAPPRPPKQKRFGWLALILTAVVALGVGGAVGGAGDTGTTTATPGATKTVTVTKTVQSDPDPGPEPDFTEEPTEAPAGWNPKPAEFKVGIKVTDKQCFGSAGCNLSYKIKLDYLGSSEIPEDGTTDITYKISGAEDPIIGTITLDSDGRFDVSEESASTTSSSKTLVAKVTEVEYNEFG